MYLGDEDEAIVHSTLEQLPSIAYRVISKVIILEGDISSQIDHIVVSLYGIFVIETKGLAGRIVGDTFDSTWTQILNGNKYIIHNPVRQNWSHVKAIEALLPELVDILFPIVVFTKEVDLEITSPANPVVKLSKLLPVIKARKEIYLLRDKVDFIVDTLEQFKIKNRSQLDEHIAKLHYKLSEERKLVYKGVCPKCSKFLTLQVNDFGTFLGCSTYPECDFVVTSQGNYYSK